MNLLAIGDYVLTISDAGYMENIDVNNDYFINLEDVMIVVKNFGKTTQDYDL